METRARVVIIGGGALGVSLLYHLTAEGWSDVLLLEKGELTSGATWHAAGLVTHTVSSLNTAKIVKYGTELYSSLETETGLPTGWHGTGSIRLATTSDEVDWITYVKGVLAYVGAEAHLLGPHELKRLHPLVSADDVLLALYTPGDGHVDPHGGVSAMATGARARGAQIFRNHLVTGIRRRGDGEWEIDTSNGAFVAEHVVNAAGSHATRVGAMVGLSVPIVNVVHQYLTTEPLQEVIDLDFELPVVRDPYASCYSRQEQDALLVGSYEMGPRLWQAEDWGSDFALLPPDVDRLLPWLERAGKRIPVFEKAGIRKVVSGPITHTPDAGFLMGPAAGLNNFWLCCGSSVGIAQGPGIGKYLAQWIVHGQTEINVREMDPRRFGDYAAGDYGVARSLDEYEQMYQVRFPGEFREAGRPIKKSTIYDRLADAGAVFGEVYGWERPKWFDHEGDGERYSFRRTNWFDEVAQECRGVHEQVGVIDLTSFSKYEVRGSDAAGFLNRISANRIPSRQGGIGLAHMLTDLGGIEAEATVTRFADDFFYVLSSIRGEQHDLDWMIDHIGGKEDITVTNITDGTGMILVTGPRAREVLAPLTDADLSNDGFPWLTGREIDVAGVPVRALRVSYAGELGWELHHPKSQTPRVYDAVMDSGAEHGIVNFGLYALESLRLEKAYKAWGIELTTEVTMLEADMGRFFRVDKEFIGREATLAQERVGRRLQCVYTVVEDGDADPIGNEPVFDGDRVIGVTTSGAYGHRVAKTLAFAFVVPEYAAVGTSFHVGILGEQRFAKVLAEPAFDPANRRMRA